MLTKEEFDIINRGRRFPSMEPRQSGKTFRNLLQAAHKSSAGERVTYWAHTEYLAKEECTKFMDTFHNWGFSRPTVSIVKQNNSEGIVRFYGLPAKYDEYLYRVLGSKTVDIFDI